MDGDGFLIFADKMRHFESSIFTVLAQKKAEAEKKGLEIIDLSVGTPDLPPAQFIVDIVRKEAGNPENYKYALQDTSALKDAGRLWYARRYGVELGEENICSIMGSQDGLAHLPLVLLNPGDTALVPNPGYPIFIGGSQVASAELYNLDLYEEKGFLPDLDAIPESVAHRAKLMLISYPMNPLGALAPPEFFEKVIWFAKKYEIAVVHDNAYSEIVFDKKECGSFLAFKGAMDVGVEFNSLSKSHNLTGARISFAVGNPEIIAALTSFKSNIDYGMFLPLQKAAIAALTGPQDSVVRLRAEYERRRNTLVREFGRAGWRIKPSEATMFVWARIPETFAGSMDFALRLIEEAGVIVVPGISFGSLGEGYVRIALVKSEEKISKAARNIERSGLLRI